MKKLILPFLVQFLFLFTQAQTSGGPDPYGYRWKSSRDPVTPPVFKWFDITSIGTLVTGLGDDNYVGPFSASSGFQYYWYSTPQFYIGSNGFLSFNGVNIASPFPAVIPDPLGGNDYIAALLADLNFAGTGNPGRCYYYSNSDTLCVSFINVPFWYSVGGTTGSNTFQFILNKVDRSITINYRKMNMGNFSAIDAIVGIENVTGTLGLGCFTDSLPPDSVALKFTYPAVVTYQVKDVGMNWNANDKNGGVFVKKGGSAKPFSASVKNFGNQTINNINVYDTVFTLAGVAVSSGSASITSLTPGQEAIVTFSDSFSAPNNVTYILKTDTWTTGDLVDANNVMESEVIAIDTAGPQMNLDYSDGTPDGTGLNWNGGGGGIAVYIEPPIYPAKVKDSRFYITALGAPAQGFHAIIYDDNGPGGGPGTTLDSVYVAPGTIAINNYKTVNVSNTVIIDSGGVYLYWGMGGAGISLARDINKPISRRTFEILGGSWSGYRDLQTEDFLLGLRVIYAFPKADFTVSYTTDPNLVFTDKSTNQPTKWLWDFGDGGTDTVQNPSHVYIDNDTFNVCLTASNQYGSDSVCKKVIVTGNVPTASFIYDSTNNPTFTFYDQSTNSPTAWLWDFGTATGDTSNLQNTAFNFKVHGVYTICLVAKNVNGSSAPFCKTINAGWLGLEELSGASVNIFPNPMKDFATIRLSGDFGGKQVRIRMINMAGAEVAVRLQNVGNDYHIFKDQIPDGQYIVEILLDDRAFARLPIQVMQ